MVARRALVLVDGVPAELPTADTLVGAGGASDPVSLATATETGLVAPTVGNLKFFARMMAGREMPGFMDSAGDKALMQPHFGRNSTVVWKPLPGTLTLQGGQGIAAPVIITGTVATARSIAATSMVTRAARFGAVSATTVGGVGGITWSTAQFHTIGSATTQLGGFQCFWRFAVSDAAAVTGARMFVGMGNVASAGPGTLDPAALLNHIGVGKIAGSNNLHIIYGGSTAQTPIDLGVNFPANTLSADLYELQLRAPHNKNEVFYRVERLNTGDVAIGTLTAATAGVQLPLNTTFLNPRAWRGNNATALAVGLDLVQMYIESDN